VAITGIDGAGKGYITAQLDKILQVAGVRTAVINIDGWLNLPDRRFDPSNPAEHFYRNAIRFDELFAQLVFPLRDRRSIHCDVAYAEETAIAYRRHLYKFENIDVILLEGIFLLKQSFQSYYDLSFWIDCGFDTALERAIARGQERLSPDATVHAYRRIYFPAQQIHFQCDRPRTAATVVFNNDAKLAVSVASPAVRPT
jgi:uridine kinase